MEIVIRCSGNVSNVSLKGHIGIECHSQKMSCMRIGCHVNVADLRLFNFACCLLGHWPASLQRFSSIVTGSIGFISSSVVPFLSGHLGASQLSDISRIYLSVCRVKLQYQHNSSRHLVFSLIPVGLSVVIRLFINGCWTGQARPHPHDLSRTFLQSCNNPLTWMGLNQAEIEKVRVQL